MKKPARKSLFSQRVDSPLSGNSSGGGYNAGLAVFSYVVGGILVWSLIGWGLDTLLGTHWIVLAGALAGVVGGFYLSAMHNLFRAKDQDGANDQDNDSRIPRVTEQD